MIRFAVSVLIFCLMVSLGIASAVMTASANDDVQSIGPRPTYIFPKVGRYEILLCDLHMHTVNSDGKLTPEERIREAWDYGYDAIAITDHAQVPAFRDSYRQGLPVAAELGMILVRGFESGVDNKEHFVILGVCEKYSAQDDHQWAEQPGQNRVFYQDKLREIADLGGFVFHPHPHVGFREPLLWGIEQGIVQGVEVKSALARQGVGSEKSHGRWWYPFAFDWALEYDLALFANTDVHDARDFDNQPFTMVLVTQKSEKGILDALHARRTIAWFDDMLVGRKDLMRDLIGSMVEIRHASKRGSGLYIRNHGPVYLKAYLRDVSGWELPVEIEPYQEMTLDLDRVPDRLIIFWDNILISPRQNLVTIHNPAQ